MFRVGSAEVTLNPQETARIDRFGSGATYRVGDRVNNFVTYLQDPVVLLSGLAGKGKSVGSSINRVYAKSSKPLFVSVIR